MRKTKSLIGQTPLMLVGLLTGIIGCAGRTDKPKETTSHSEESHSSRPKLPNEWAGRWQPDPFAETEWIEVRHQARSGGPGDVYLVKDAKAVESLLQEMKITGIHNDIARGSIPPAFITFHKKGARDLECGIENGGCLSTFAGEVYLHRGFFAALNRQLTAQEHRPVNVLESLPSVPLPQPAPSVKSSVRSLTAGFKSITVQYVVGKRLRSATIKDRKTLDELHKTLTILKQESALGEKPQSRGLMIESKDGSTFYGQVLSSTEFFDSSAGKFTVASSFLKSLNHQVSYLEGYSINLADDNALPEAQVNQALKIRGLLGEVKSLRFSSGKRADLVTVDDPGKVAELIKALGWIEVPARKIKLEKGDLTIELTMMTGNKVLMTYLQTGSNNDMVVVGPLMGDLVDMTGIGPVWIDNQWKYRLERYVSEKEQEAKGRRASETANLVARDLPAFLKQVLNVVAYYRHGDHQISACLSADESRPIIDILASGKVEALDWSPDRWKRELDSQTKRDAGSLDLTPGLGFYLTLGISHEKEFLIPMYGKLTFSDSPIPLIQKAIAGKEYQPDSIQLMPR